MLGHSRGGLVCGVKAWNVSTGGRSSLDFQFTSVTFDTNQTILYDNYVTFDTFDTNQTIVYDNYVSIDSNQKQKQGWRQSKKYSTGSPRKNGKSKTVLMGNKLLFSAVFSRE